MSPTTRMRRRITVVLHMVMAFTVMILLAQLWLFTVALDAMQSREASAAVVVAALVVSLLGFAAVYILIRYFLRAEEQH